MATTGTQIIANMVAGEDLSTRQYWPVTLSGSDNKCASPTSNEKPMPIGVLQNAPSAVGEPADVCVYGLTKMIFNTVCDLKAGDQFTLDASYLGEVNLDASGVCFGRSMEAAVTGCPIVAVIWRGCQGFEGDAV